VVRPHLVPMGGARLHLPFAVADYVDFYASRNHAENVGRIFRPGQPPLPRNWLHMPLGYHGRAGSVVISGTPVARPNGQRREPGNDEPSFGPCLRLDFEAEVGFVAGVPSRHGESVPVADFERHVFGACLVNDWSARDIQSFETVPLGPFLGKAFATSVSPWVVPLDALGAARVAPPPRDLLPPPYLRDGPDPWGLDLSLEVRINGCLVSRPPFATMYWTPAQMLAHLTCGGAPVRTGDLFASGTVSGPGRDQLGCLLELTRDGAEPIALADGGRRAFLEDGDEVVISATAARSGRCGAQPRRGTRPGGRQPRLITPPQPPAQPSPAWRMALHGRPDVRQEGPPAVGQRATARAHRPSSGLIPRHEQVKQRYKSGPADDSAPVDEPGDVGQRDPLDPVGLGAIGRRAGVPGAVGAEQVVHRVHRPVGRLGGDKQAHRPGPPAGLLLDLAGRGLLGGLALLDPSHRHLPAPGAGDMPVPPDQQHLAGFPDDRGAGHRAGHPHHVLLEPLPIGEFHVHKVEAHPGAFIDRPTSVDRPLHDWALPLGQPGPGGAAGIVARTFSANSRACGYCGKRVSARTAN